MRLSTAMRKIVIAFCFFFLAGIVNANIIFFCISLLFFMLVLAGFIFHPPRSISFSRRLSADKSHVGDILTVTLEVHIREGLGIVVFEDLIPPFFELADGSNYKIFWKNASSETLKMEYQLRCLSSGSHQLKGVKWELRHFLFDDIRSGEQKLVSNIDILPNRLEVKKLTGYRKKTPLLMPAGAQVNIGASTQELRDMRMYVPGDQFRNINWKATSRSIFRGIPWPVVNEFEREGRKNVWILVDRESYMKAGSNVRNVMEYALEAANGLADYYLNQNCMVGFSTFNYYQKTILPAGGNKQYLKIRKALVGLAFTKDKKVEDFQPWFYPLQEVIKANRKYLCGSRPLFIIITSYHRSRAEALYDGIVEMLKYTGNTGHKSNVMVMNILNYGLFPKEDGQIIAQQLLKSLNRLEYAHFRKKCIWIDWDPSTSSLSNVLLGRK